MRTRTSRKTATLITTRRCQDTVGADQEISAHWRTSPCRQSAPVWRMVQFLMRLRIMLFFYKI